MSLLSFTRLFVSRVVPLTQRAIIEHLQDGAPVLDPWRRIVAINPAALGDLRAVERAAHRLKSSSALVGVPMLPELCDQLVRIASEFAYVRVLLST